MICCPTGFGNKQVGGLAEVSGDDRDRHQRQRVLDPVDAEVPVL
jgi:hypothetical protein